MMIGFKKAERKQAKLRLAITGPSGSGKTFSGLLMASGIGKRIAVIDTENHSASLYAGEKGLPEFDTLEIEPPYTVPKYIEAIRAAVDAKYDVLIIDSITHAWAGEGGLLAKKESLDVSGRGNSYTNWSTITKEHEQFKAMLLNCDIHLIVTMRSKQDYVLETNEKGKQTPRKVGLAPIQRDGMEYEFTMVLDMGMDHSAMVSKTRVRTFDGQLFRPSKKTGSELCEWLMEGKAQEPAPALVTMEEAKEIHGLARDKKIENAKLLEHLNVSRLGDLEKSRIDEAKVWIASHPVPKEEPKPAAAPQPKPGASIDMEMEFYIKAGFGSGDVADYVETLPFSSDLNAVAAHLKNLRETNNPAMLRALMVKNAST